MQLTYSALGPLASPRILYTWSACRPTWQSSSCQRVRQICPFPIVSCTCLCCPCSDTAKRRGESWGLQRPLASPSSSGATLPFPYSWLHLSLRPGNYIMIYATIGECLYSKSTASYHSYFFSSWLSSGEYSISCLWLFHSSACAWLSCHYHYPPPPIPLWFPPLPPISLLFPLPPHWSVSSSWYCMGCPCLSSSSGGSSSSSTSSYNQKKKLEETFLLLLVDCNGCRLCVLCIYTHCQRGSLLSCGRISWSLDQRSTSIQHDLAVSNWSKKSANLYFRDGTNVCVCLFIYCSLCPDICTPLLAV